MSRAAVYDRSGREERHAHPVDVALLDIRMPGDGIAAPVEITRHSPRTRVVMLTAFGEEPTVASALRAGAHGYLLKDTGPHDLIDAVRRAAAGEPVLAPQITRQLIEFRARPGHGSDTAARRIAVLTPAELGVLRLLGTGLSNAGNAAQLHLSPGTIKAHISNILTRTNCTNRVQAAVLAQEAGLLG